jgi:hypothetical protein
MRLSSNVPAITLTLLCLFHTLTLSVASDVDSPTHRRANKGPPPPQPAAFPVLKAKDDRVQAPVQPAAAKAKSPPKERVRPLPTSREEL